MKSDLKPVFPVACRWCNSKQLLWCVSGWNSGHESTAVASIDWLRLVLGCWTLCGSNPKDTLLYGFMSKGWQCCLLLWYFTDFYMNGKWEQNLLSPGGSGPRNFSASSSPMSTLSSNYRGAGGSFNTEVTTTYLSGPGRISMRTLSKWSEIHPKHHCALCHYPLIFPPVVGSSHRSNVSGGVHTSEVTMRKRSENRVYTDENIRDSIVMGELSTKFPDFGKL